MLAKNRGARYTEPKPHKNEGGAVRVAASAHAVNTLLSICTKVGAKIQEIPTFAIRAFALTLPRVHGTISKTYVKMTGRSLPE